MVDKGACRWMGRIRIARTGTDEPDGSWDDVEREEGGENEPLHPAAKVIAHKTLAQVDNLYVRPTRLQSLF
jgi:hypothetical protein